MHSPVLTFLPAVLLLSHLASCTRRLDVQTEIKNERDRQAQINKWNYNLDKHLNMPTRRELETHQEKTVQAPREIPISIMMLAQPTEDRSRDTIVFEFDARQQAHVLQSGLAYLMIRLRDVRKKKRNNKNSKQSSENDLKEKMKNVTDGTVLSEQMRKKLDQLKNEQNEEGVDSSDRRSQKERAEKMQILKNFTEAFNNGNAIGKGKEEKNKARKNKQEKNKEEEDEDEERRGKGKTKRHLTVKVVVRVVDQDTGKEKRIAAVNVEVKAKKTLLSVPIRKSVLIDAATSPRHTLVLKIACKRCKKRVHMDMLYRSPKHKNEAYPTTDLELNPNRPYLVIPTLATSDSSDNSGRDGRSKRHAGSPCSTPGSTQCCSERIFITFQELGMDKVIVYPKGFHTVTCVGRCLTNTDKTLGDSDQLVIQTNSTSTKLSEIPETDSNSSIQGVKNCQPVRKSSLDIYYLDEMKNIIPRRLVDFVDEECGCVS
ncbi:uncharacterized protein LOC131957015 [Physella acuta]|uniref:uncharacterized protein LOC131957015 n=1 Tax=Physella acuta TaxID=109671 RepID=UPI0027DB24E7|nr:uncharacterized protein LOC131957015 [Physella acuta]